MGPASRRGWEVWSGGAGEEVWLGPVVGVPHTRALLSVALVLTIPLINIMSPLTLCPGIYILSPGAVDRSSIKVDHLWWAGFVGELVLHAVGLHPFILSAAAVAFGQLGNWTAITE